MTKRLLMVLIAVIVVVLAIAVYLLFFMPAKQVYDGVLINQGIQQLLCRGY